MWRLKRCSLQDVTSSYLQVLRCTQCVHVRPLACTLNVHEDGVIVVVRWKLDCMHFNMPLESYMCGTPVWIHCVCHLDGMPWHTVLERQHSPTQWIAAAWPWRWKWHWCCWCYLLWTRTKFLGKMVDPRDMHSSKSQGLQGHSLAPCQMHSSHWGMHWHAKGFP